MNKKTFDINNSLDEYIDNLLNTRDIALYLESLAVLKNQYLIILSVKDTPSKISVDILKKIQSIGF